MKKTICILVLYNPNKDLMFAGIDSVINSVEALWISDNSPVSSFSQCSFTGKYGNKVIYHSMKGNVGIAAAQNAGLKYAITKEFEYIFYLDQDSISPVGMIDQLFCDLEKLEQKGEKVVAIGPRPINRQSDKEYKGSVNKGKDVGEGISKVSELMSSASIIKVENFVKVGLMEEQLFIDAVDFEWCWRAKTIIGGNCFISENAKLSHQLGEGDKFFVVRKVAIPTSFRVYFQFRNYLWLLSRNYVPFYWKFSNAIKYSIKFFYYPIFVSPRAMYLKQIFKGIKDGLFNRPKRTKIK